MLSLSFGLTRYIPSDSNPYWHIQFTISLFLLTLEILRDEYNIAYIFNSIEDIEALKDFVKSPNRNIKKVALEVIAEKHII